MLQIGLCADADQTGFAMQGRMAAGGALQYGRMNVDDLFTTKGDDTVVLQVHVQPGSGRSAVVGRHGSSLKVRVAAPPVDGRANTACAEVLAEEFGLKTAQVSLVGGETSRSKTFTLAGLDIDDFRRHLELVVGAGQSRAGQSRPGPENPGAGRL